MCAGQKVDLIIAEQTREADLNELHAEHERQIKQMQEQVAEAKKTAEKAERDRQRLEVQKEDYRQQTLAQKERIKSVVAGLTPVLDAIDYDFEDLPEVPELGRPARPVITPEEAFANRCRHAWSNFKDHVLWAASGAAAHTLRVVKSYCPKFDFRYAQEGFSKDTTEEEAKAFVEAARPAADALVQDLSLFINGE